MDLRRFIPLLIVIAIVAVFFKMMDGERNPREIKSVLIGNEAPAFTLPALFEGNDALTEKVLQSGKPVVVNFFASWCVPCRAEHDNLMRLSARDDILMIGIAYKDKPEKSRAFLRDLGNPFDLTAIDLNGRTAIDWGVTGVPETFLVSPDGIVAYRHWGPIVGDTLETRLLPELEEIQ